MGRGPRRAMLARVSLGSVLGGVLVVAGMWLIRRTLGAGGSFDGYAAPLGATGVAAGLEWFMIVVADRICPLTRRGLVDLCEGLLLVVVLLGVGWSAQMLLMHEGLG